MKVTADGEIEWEQATWESIRCPSSDTNLRVRCDGRKLEGSANIGRFGETDNVTGLTVAQCVEKWERILGRLGFDVTGFGGRAQIRGPSGLLLQERGTFLRRVDLAGNLDTDDYSALSTILMSRRIGQKLPMLGKYGPTWGFDAKRGNWWKAKLYDKTAEQEGKRRSDGGATRARFEVKLGGEWLRREALDSLEKWKDEKMGNVVYARFADQVFKDTVTAERWDEIPTRLRGFAYAWRDGADLRSELCKSVFYRTRKQLMPFGLDIGTPCNVLSLTQRIHTVQIMPVSALRKAA